MRRAWAGERRDASSRDVLQQRIEAEFNEMPCLRLTAAQACRLFGLTPEVGDRLLSQLVDQGVLRLDPDGRYATVPAC